MSIKAKHRDIVLNNIELLKKIEKLGLVKIDDKEIDRLTKTCWGCGIESKTKMSRCHIVAKIKGGSDDENNLLLLCDVCHKEQPDGLDREIQIEWLIEREGYFERNQKLWEDWSEKLSNLGDFEAYVSKNYKRIFKVLEEGYFSAAGWENGRSNAFCMLKHDFRKWISKN